MRVMIQGQGVPIL